jgi:hypothetical protein
VNYSIAAGRPECYRQLKRVGAIDVRIRGHCAGSLTHWWNAAGPYGGWLAGRRVRKEQVAVIYGEPETMRFLEALRRLKLQQLRKDRQTKQAKQKVRAVVRKIRAY